MSLSSVGSSLSDSSNTTDPNVLDLAGDLPDTSSSHEPIPEGYLSIRSMSGHVRIDVPHFAPKAMRILQRLTLRGPRDPSPMEIDHVGPSEGDTSQAVDSFLRTRAFPKAGGAGQALLDPGKTTNVASSVPTSQPMLTMPNVPIN